MNSFRGTEAEAAEGPPEAHKGDLAGVGWLRTETTIGFLRC